MIGVRHIQRVFAPSVLTALRAALALPILVIPWGPVPTSGLLWLLIFAAATDLLDGPLARRLGVASVLGAWLDSVADCLVALAVFAAFARAGIYPAWVLALIAVMFAQFILTSGRGGPRYDPVGRSYGAFLYGVAIGTAALPDFGVNQTLLLALVILTALVLASRVAGFLQDGMKRGGSAAAGT